MKLLVMTVCLALAAQVNAQTLPVSLFPSPSASSSSLQSAPRLVTGGVLGGAAGFVLGFLAGAVISHDEDDEDGIEALSGGVIGATIGESLGLATGVHLANKRQGNLAVSSAASLAIGAAGWALFRYWEQGFPQGPIIIGTTVIAQIATVIALEKR